jgi:glutamine amidotransferase
MPRIFPLMIAIVDYGAGNLTSVKRALDYLGLACEVTPDPSAVSRAERVVFPGVGHAASAMATLKVRGLDRALSDAYGRGTPILGICLGAQIVLSRSEEGDTACLGLIEGSCPRFRLEDKALKIPHMGWDSIRLAAKPFVLKHVEQDDEFYFVHSYYPLPQDDACVLATCNYEIDFPAVVGNGNLLATQFHPEKSGEAGLEILRNFSVWDGA